MYTYQLLSYYRRGMRILAPDGTTPVDYRPVTKHDQTPWQASNGRRYRAQECTVGPEVTEEQQKLDETYSMIGTLLIMHATPPRSVPERKPQVIIRTRTRHKTATRTVPDHLLNKVVEQVEEAATTSGCSARWKSHQLPDGRWRVTAFCRHTGSAVGLSYNPEKAYKEARSHFISQHTWLRSQDQL